MNLAEIDVASWHWIATSAVGVGCMLFGWLLRVYRDRLTRAETAVIELQKRIEVIARMSAVTDSAVSTGLAESITGLQKDVRELHRKIETSCADLGKKVDTIMGRLLDWSTSVSVQAKKE